MSLQDLPKDITDAATAAAGNWARFESFAWHDQPDDADKWMIVNTTNRDADTLTKSNHAVMERELSRFSDDVNAHSASHWACGWVEGFEVRVFAADGSITDAFKALHSLAMALACYPVLDESDYSEREASETDETIESIGDMYLSSRAPKSWVARVSSHMYHDGCDMSPDCIGEEHVLRAMAALRYLDRDGRKRLTQIG